ncbi:hypothetical protein [Clostridium sp.]|uniref:hypothetical protein n=1 Tax=Clostridium sp. TaxID=1506 RepID=UPI002852A3BC|nr:hypothetical protein [Clostridium sp.]
MKTEFKKLLILLILSVEITSFLGCNLGTNKKVSQKDIPVVYIKNENYYKYTVSKGEVKLPDDIEEIKYVYDDGTIYYEDKENKLCSYDNKLNKKSILDDSIEGKNVNVYKSSDGSREVFNLSQNGGNSNNNPIYIRNNGKDVVKISDDGKVKTITSQNEVIYQEKDDILCLTKNNEKEVIGNNNYKVLVWNELYGKLIYDKKVDKNIITLNVWDSKTQKSSKVFEFKPDLAGWFDDDKVVMLNKDTIIFSTFSFKGSIINIGITDLSGNAKQIASGSDNEIKGISILNSSNDYGIDGVDENVNLNRVYYTKKENEQYYKKDVLYYYDINSGNTIKVTDDIDNFGFRLYSDRIYYETPHNEFVEIVNEGNKKQIVGKIVKQKDSHGTIQRIGSNTYFYNGTDTIYKNGKAVVENMEKIIASNEFKKPIYFIKDGQLNVFSSEDDSVNTISSDISSINKVYIQNDKIDITVKNNK